LSGISTPGNLLEAGFCSGLRSNITSSEEQSSSRRERDQSFQELGNERRDSGEEALTACVVTGELGDCRRKLTVAEQFRDDEVVIWKSNQSFKKSDPWGDVSQEVSPFRFVSLSTVHFVGRDNISADDRSDAPVHRAVDSATSFTHDS
jgi:hypothetical protein